MTFTIVVLDKIINKYLNIFSVQLLQHSVLLEKQMQRATVMKNVAYFIGNFTLSVK